jgi:protein involved in temperature-dependent protein secretion
MQDGNEKRKMILEAAIRTIATACRHLYQEEINTAKARGDVMAVVQTKARMQKDWEAWTAPLTEALNACDKPPLVIAADEA